MSIFAACCEGRTFDNEKGWRAARRDGVEMRNSLLQFLLISIQELCSSHAPSLSVAAWRPTRRRNFWLATFSEQLNAAVINYYFTAHLRTRDCET